MLVKHLDNKVVLKQPNLQLDIVEVTSSLAKHAKAQPSVAIVGALRDLLRHLRKSIQCSFETSLDADVVNWNKMFREAVDECLVQLSIKVFHVSFIFLLNLWLNLYSNRPLISKIITLQLSCFSNFYSFSFP